MARKIIQISMASVEYSQRTQIDFVTMALCDDGTLWHKCDLDGEWYKDDNVPQETK